MGADSNEMVIPKIIHYCWFGGKEKPKSVQQYIKTWRKYFPDYRIVEWNETNFDVSCTQYSQQAYEAKKYAFVADVARVYAMYNEGGIYFDTDIEVLKNFEDLLKGKRLVLSNESEQAIMTGFFAATPHNELCSDIILFYQKTHFILENGKYNLYPNTYLFREIVQKKYNLGYSQEVENYDNVIILYPREYFTGIEVGTHKLAITKNTVTIHHMEASWHPWSQRIKSKAKRTLKKIGLMKI